LEDKYKIITDIALSTKSKNPMNIAIEMMKNDLINMHGPEHHYLVVAALLAAYSNCTDIDLEKMLGEAAKRAQNVPGAICGLWGSCGAGIASGIFISIITGTTGQSKEEWSQANKMTSISLDNISKNGGPRCCKRDSYLAIQSAVGYVKDVFGIEMEDSKDITCQFYSKNPTCKLSDCIFYPDAKISKEKNNEQHFHNNQKPHTPSQTQSRYIRLRQILHRSHVHHGL